MRGATSRETTLALCLLALSFILSNPRRTWGLSSDPYPLGVQAFEQGRVTEALQLFQQAARLHPQDARVSNALGNTWLTLNQPSKARQEYRRAITLDPRLWAARKNLGILEYQQGHFLVAARQFVSVTQVVPRDAVAWRFLGLSLEASKRNQEALAPLQKALALEPGNAAVRLDLARVEAETGATEAALSDYRRLVGNPALEPGSQKSVGLGLAAKGEAADAISQFQFILARDPSDEEVTWALAQEYMKAQQPDQAIATLKAGLANARDKAGFYDFLGWIYQQTNHANEAGEAYRQAIVDDPKRPEAYLQLSWLYAEFRHFDDAAETLREGLRFVPEPFNLKLQLGTILVWGGHEREAVPVLQEVIAAQPHNPAGYTTLIINYTLLDPSYDRPLQIAEKALKECPDNYLTHYLYAGVLFRQHRQDLGQPGSAAIVQRIKSELLASTRLNSDFPHSYYDLARVEFETGDYPAAEREALAALHADRDFTDARYLLGRIYKKEGRKKEGDAEIVQVEQQHLEEIRQVESVGQALLAQQAAATGSRVPVLAKAPQAALTGVSK
jgi:tetratricopeptide (TPR) repeat protein